MRSPRAVAAALILLLGVPLALIAQIALGGGAENVLHLAMAGGFLLLALAVFDFRLLPWIDAGAYGGGEAPGALKLFYLPLFIWLLLEGRERSDRLSSGTPSFPL